MIYNMYGSTEIAFATIAEPKHLEFNSSTVGPVVKGVKVKIFDDNGQELPQGEVGRIFVGNAFPFEGYTGGGKKQIIDGLLSSGDVGYFDENGLLYISGRDDVALLGGPRRAVHGQYPEGKVGDGQARAPQPLRRRPPRHRHGERPPPQGQAGPA